MEDVQAQQGQAWLEEFLQLSNLNAVVRIEKPLVPLEADACWLVIDEANLSPEQIQTLIGTDGSVIDAIQYLANSILNLGKSHTEQRAFTVELAGYRVKRQTELLKIADVAAAHVRETGEQQVMKSLSAAERRIIHTYLKEFEDLETFSQGQEPHRYLTVRLAHSALEAESDSDNHPL
jgi:spoIIIJ-associated protein